MGGDSPHSFFFLLWMMAPRDIGRRLELQTYLFFKWKTPSAPQALWLLAGFRPFAVIWWLRLQNQPSPAEARCAVQGQWGPWDGVGQPRDPGAAASLG